MEENLKVADVLRLALHHIVQPKAAVKIIWNFKLEVYGNVNFEICKKFVL